MPRRFFEANPELPNVVTVRVNAIRMAERLILGCESCRPKNSDVSFSWVLDLISGADPLTRSDYVLEDSAKCPTCRREILKTTLVEPMD